MCPEEIAECERQEHSPGELDVLSLVASVKGKLDHDESHIEEQRTTIAVAHEGIKVDQDREDIEMKDA